MNGRPRAALSSIFESFLCLGMTAFGGPAMVAHIGELAVDKKGWLRRDEFQAGVALAQSIPGATAMQTAAYCGLRAGGKLGAAAAYVGFGLPATVLMIGLSAAYSITQRSPINAALFRGLQVIVVAIVARAAIVFGRSAMKSLPAVVIAAAAACCLMYGCSPFAVIGAAALFGMLICRASSGVDAGVQNRRDTAPLQWLAKAVAIAASALAALWFVSPRLFDLSVLMMRIDILAFGGGFASVPIMFDQVVHARHWLDSQTFMDGIAMGQVTPGPIVITATFVGYQVAGPVGAIIATIAVFLPSFIIVVVMEPYFSRLKRSAVFQRAIAGVLASFVGLLLSTTIRFGLAAQWNLPAVLLCCAAFAALMLKVEILPVVVVGGLISVLALR